MRFRDPVSFVFAGAVLLAFAGCTHHEKRNPASQNPGEIHLRLYSDVASLDPASAYSNPGEIVPANIYESLYQYSYLGDPPAPEPLLAAGFPRYSADHLTLTIGIKHGIHFADDPCFRATGGKGREVTAEDFVYSLKRIALPKPGANSWWSLDDRVVGINDLHEKMEKAANRKELLALLDQPIEGIQAKGRYELQLKLTRPDPQLIYILSMRMTGVVPREAVEAYSDKDGQLLDHAVGTGPYRLESWRRGVSLTLSKNPTYHDDFYPRHAAKAFRDAYHLEAAGKRLPQVNRIQFRIIHQNWTAWLEFLKGNLDELELSKDAFSEAISSTDSRKLSPEARAKGIRLTVNNPLTGRFLVLNMRDPLIGKNKLLRQALSSAIDRRAWIRIFGNNMGRVMTSPLPPGVAGRPENPVLKYDYNPDRARKLLKEAGYPGGQGLPPLELELGSPETTNRQIGEFLAAQFHAIGIKVEPELDSSVTAISKLHHGAFQIDKAGWMLDYPDAENAYLPLYGKDIGTGPNWAGFQNAKFDHLYEKMAAMRPSLERSRLIARMDEIVQEEVPWIMLEYPRQYRLTQKRLLNYRFNDLLFNYYKYLGLAAPTGPN